MSFHSEHKTSKIAARNAGSQGPQQQTFKRIEFDTTLPFLTHGQTVERLFIVLGDSNCE